MRKWLLPLLLVLSLLLPIGVQAQNTVAIDLLQIQIWPEYDKPSVLVIYQLTLSPTTTFPASLSVRIPVSAGDPHAVAVRQVDGTLYSMDYTRQVAGEWALINFTTTTSEIQLEYYDPDLERDGDSRHFAYTWPGDYAISQLIIQVQQPAGANNMRISPSLGAGVKGSDNLTYFNQDVGAISAGQNIRISMDYQKTDDTLSAENLPVQPSAPIPQGTAPDLSVSTWLPYVLGIFGAALIIGGIIWFWQTGRQKPNTGTYRRRSRAPAGKPTPAAGSSEVGIYCSQCGKRAGPGDLFCRSCGTQIRSR